MSSLPAGIGKKKLLAYQGILMAAGSIESDSCYGMIHAQKHNLQSLEELADMKYFERKDRGAGEVGYKLTEKGRKESEFIWKQNCGDLISSL